MLICQHPKNKGGILIVVHLISNRYTITFERQVLSGKYMGNDGYVI